MEKVVRYLIEESESGIYHVLAQSKQDIKDAIPGIQFGALIYPLDRKSKEECERIIENLKKHP